MSSSSAMSSQFLRFPNQTLFHPHPHHYFVSPLCKPSACLPVLSLSFSVKGPTLTVDNEVTTVQNIYATPIEDKQGNSYIARKTSKFRVKGFVEKVKNLISEERTEEILELFEEEDEFRTIFLFNDLLMAFSLAEKPDFALKLSSNLSCYRLLPDGRTFSILIRCFCKKQNSDEAFNILKHMVGKGYRPSPTTITILINAFCKKGKLKKAFEVFDFMGRMGNKPDIQHYNCLLKGLCYVGKVEEACEMLIKIKKEGVKPDIYCYTALMDGLCKVGRSDEAMELLYDAMEMGLSPNVVTFNTLFNGYCKEGRPLEGIGVLKKMEEVNCKPDYITYSTFLHGLLKWGKARTALRIYKKMLGFGHVVEERMMNTLVRSLCRRSFQEDDLLKDVHQLFDKMREEDYSIDGTTFELVIQASCSGKKIDEGLVNLLRMIEMGYVPTGITFDAVITALCAGGKFEEALLILVRMNEGRVIPSRVTFQMLIGEFDRQGWRRSACQVRAAAFKLGCCFADDGSPSSDLPQVNDVRIDFNKDNVRLTFLCTDYSL